MGHHHPGSSEFLGPRCCLPGLQFQQNCSTIEATGEWKINVAFIISEGANVMDIAGPWEVFSDAMLTSKGNPWHESDGDDMVMPFNVYTVSDSLKPVDANGLAIVPKYTFDNAPKPQVIVIPLKEAAPRHRKNGC
jgi:hypothetical protein